ncbi:ferritin-like domain-containing protein [Mucilaginibacter defluvii]|uniref:Ferritin-like domain-containing protein n=1 Tax=Mucilaginibacter defluvii TaxID=1196019 RepID=A0ABP9G6E9_9SPHI
MHTSNYWVAHFRANATQHRINWEQLPLISLKEIDHILPSLQAWQLGETSEGKQLIAAATRYADKTNDPAYLEAIKLFIKEEQKHGNNLGKYLDVLDLPRIKHNWGDSLFRFARHLNTSMEMWTLAVITVESTAQIFYQALKNATNCPLLKEICTDILIDEAYHITFQTERLDMIFANKSTFSKAWRPIAYKVFYYATIITVWMAHRKLFRAGGVGFVAYFRKLRYKYAKTIKSITHTSGFVQFA